MQWEFRTRAGKEYKIVILPSMGMFSVFRRNSEPVKSGERRIGTDGQTLMMFESYRNLGSIQLRNGATDPEGLRRRIKRLIMEGELRRWKEN